MTSKVKRVTGENKRDAMSKVLLKYSPYFGSNRAYLKRSLHCQTKSSVKYLTFCHREVLIKYLYFLSS